MKNLHSFLINHLLIYSILLFVLNCSNFSVTDLLSPQTMMDKAATAAKKKAQQKTCEVSCEKSSGYKLVKDEDKKSKLDKLPKDEKVIALEKASKKVYDECLQKCMSVPLP